MRKLCFSVLLWSLLTALPAAAKDDPMTPPLSGAVVHQVSDGDSLETLSRLYGVSFEALKELNQVERLDGQTMLWIPPSESGWPSHHVERGQTLWRIGKAYGIPVEQLRQANNIYDNRLLPGNVLILPRAKKPDWTLPQEVVVSTSPSDPEGPLMGTHGGSRPRGALSSRSGASYIEPTLELTGLGEWVEVRLPDNRTAWVPSESLVLGALQPQNRDFLVETARRFVGVPYQWGGSNPNGYDCSGYVQEVFRLSGHNVPRMADIQYNELDKVSMSELRAGDLVFFNTDGSGVSHVGIYTQDGHFLHASSSRGVIESHLEENYYSSRFVGGARLQAW
jgi:LysM repeat protein